MCTCMILCCVVTETKFINFSGADAVQSISTSCNVPLTTRCSVSN